MAHADVEKLLQQGVELHQQGHLQAAQKCYKNVLRAVPDHADAHNLLGIIAGEQKQFGPAVKCLETAVRLKPAEPVFRNNLGNTLLRAKEYALAIEQLKEAVRLNPQYTEAICNLGLANSGAGQLAEARHMFQEAMRVDPSNRRAPFLLAQLEARSGQAKEAVQKYRNMRKQRPTSIGAIQGVLLSDKVTKDTPEVAEAEYILREGNLSSAQRSAMLHVLGKAYDDLGRYEEAMGLVIEGKKLEPTKYDIGAYIRWVEDVCRLFSPEFFAARSGYGSDSEVPVFIVGMPRSGTTLVEQVIASHPQAYGAGELPQLGRAARAMGINSKQFVVDTPKALKLERETVQNLAALYLERLSNGARNALRVTDKAPLNGRFLGVAALLLPRAKIIYCTRNPLDTCVSIFMQKFEAGHNYSNNLKMLGQYYRAYAGLMEQWKKMFSQMIIEVNYEDSVDDLKAQSRRIISHIGLEWDEACLNFQSTERPVFTASKWQVRQPVYRTSVERWRRYEKHLGPLIDSLGDLAAGSAGTNR